MLIKGELAKSLPLDIIKHKYNHSLVKAWADIKELHATEALAEFDAAI